MTTLSGAARGLAGVVALVAWAGLSIQFAASFGRVGSALGAAWMMLRYFTVITNLLLALVLTGVALGRPRAAAPSLLAGVALAILLVGVVYNLLLRDLLDLSGGARIADVLLHQAAPALGVIFWLAYAPKGALRPLDPVIWAIYPLAYFAYALARGAAEGVYAYPFMNVRQIGWAATGINAVAIAVGFLAAGYVVVWLDGRLARRRSGVG